MKQSEVRTTSVWLRLEGKAMHWMDEIDETDDMKMRLAGMQKGVGRIL